MRVGNALLVAGIVIVIAALSGASFAADDGGRTPPATDVVTPDDAAEVPEPAGEESAPPEPADDEGDRVPAEVETEEVAPDDEGDRGKGGRKDSDDEGKERGGGGAPDKQPRATIGVTMKDIQFKPKNVTVKPGDEITWTNRDTAQHDAVANDGSFNTELLSKGQKETLPFNEAGTFKYTCSVHPTMKGKVVVSSGDSGGNGGSGGTSSSTGGTSSGTGSTGSSTGTSGFNSGLSGSSGSSSSGSGSLPNTGQAELPLLLLGASLIVVGLLARAFREYWIWR